MSLTGNEKIVIQSSPVSKSNDHNVSDGDWNEYSRMVLKELETLNNGLTRLSSDMSQTKSEILKIQAKLDVIDDLKVWKKNFDEIAPVTQVKDLVRDVNDLKMFKIKAVTVFAIVQFSMVAFGIFAKYIS